MGCLLIPAAIALLAYLNAVIVRLFRGRDAGSGWWVVLWLTRLAGAVLGCWGGFFFEYQPSPKLRVLGAPVPVVVLHWEGRPGEEQWIDFVTPMPLLFAGSNVFILGLLA